ncbi:Aldo/keto reductase [Cryphonectria parasitica EP155]|uniref:Aldo/keto reductase n=1 Tax=Cryphonectria parasitica (strain ATCC 38755 / EP155) TaxID=660469 RepID=A0A9P5CND0_CRYP1|nr:Aldo/keto reductase [Cryphonectria parasitica EP155]KAF3764192.1 Aldo/keto reductase [Cryphonectria parasitica EP155]
MASPKGFPSLTLNDGNTIPVVAYGLGTANGKKGRKEFDEGLVNITVKALKAGFTHLDGAEAYGNEAELGAAVKASSVPREDLFITTKATARADKPLEENFSASLARLGLDYVDLYLIHSPFFTTDPKILQAKWAEMEAIRASGRAKSIGVSNFIQEHLDAVLETAKVPPAINQIEFHPYLQHVTQDRGEDLLGFQGEKGIATSGYGGLTALTRAAPGPVDGAYAELADKYGVTEGDVALRWTLDKGVIAITTSSREERLQEYLDKLPSFSLTEDEVKEISDLGHKKHFRAFWKGQFDEDDWR